MVDAAQRLHAYAAELEGLARLGFELRDEIVDDCGFIGRPDDGGPIDPEDWPESDLDDDLTPAG